MGARGYGYNLNNKILSIKLIYLYNKLTPIIFTPENTRKHQINFKYIFKEFLLFILITKKSLLPSAFLHRLPLLLFVITAIHLLLSWSSVNVPKMKFCKKTFITHFLCILMGYIF
ncbi:hypothetical protein CRI66_18570 [Escherichia sp. E4694]|nr:hypothetical protein CRI66_18570 [Escherichia sp. E4694]